MKRRHLLWLIILLVFPTMLFSQLKRDTSFTVHSSYLKEKKKFPFIQIPSYALPQGVAVKNDMVYRTINNRQLLADIYLPVKGKNKRSPAVLLVFGGGWKSGNKDHWITYAQQLAANGFVAVAVEYRLSSEAQFPAAVEDLKAAVQWMRIQASRLGIDKNKIAVAGVSAGGQLASLLGTTNCNALFSPNGKCKPSCDVQAVVNIDGILAFHHPESAEGKVAAEWLGGTYEEKPANWEKASPLNHVDCNAAPVLFLNSSLPRFHAGRDDMIRKLDSLQIFSQVKTYPNTPHTFWFFHPWFDDVVSETVTFLQKIFTKEEK